MKEHDIQAGFFELCRLHEQRDPRFKNIFSIPNAAKRSFALARWMKNEGLQAGVLDVFCMVASGVFHGLFVEFKTKKGKLSDAQRDFAARAMRAGYPVIIATDAEDAFRAVRKYFDRPEYFEGKV